MKKHTWRKSEVIAYLEDKIIDGIATEEEEILYQDFKLYGVLKVNYTYKELLNEMNDEYVGS